MPRNFFGGSHLDMVLTTSRLGARRLLAIKPYAVLTFWDSESGGARYTDLLLNGVPVNAITSDGDGYYPEFQGPDGVESMWVDDGDGVRHKIYTSQARATSVDTVLTATVSGGTYSLDPATATYYSLNLTGDTTLAVANFEEGQSVTVELVQDSTGGHVVTLPGEWLGAAETTLTSTANTVERLVVWVAAGRTNVQRASNGPFALASDWTPDDLANQIAWYDANQIAAADATEMTVVPNQWTELDLVGSGTAGTYPTVQTVNGRRVLRFDGSDDMLTTGTAAGTETNWASGPYSQPLTVGVVVKVAAAVGSTQSVLSPRDGAGGVRTYVTGSGAGSNWTANNGTALTGATDDNAWTTVVTVLTSPGTAAIRVDGVEATGNAGSEGCSSLRVGANSVPANFTGMDVAEVLVVGHAVSGQELIDLEAYLNGVRDTLAGV